VTFKTYIGIPVPPILLGNSHIPAECLDAFPHITLHHLGDKVTQEQLDAVVASVTLAAQGEQPFKVELTGLGTFFRGRTQVPIVLVNSYAICKFWHRVELFLSGVGVKRQGQFGFLPHVTLDGFKDAFGRPQWMATFRTTTCTLSEVVVVAKDVASGVKRVETIKLPGESQWSLATPDEVAYSVAAAVHNRAAEQSRNAAQVDLPPPLGFDTSDGGET
jgi:2'-5' RNA ligase